MGLNMQGSFSFNFGAEGLFGGGGLFGGPGGVANFLPPGQIAPPLGSGNNRSQLLNALADLFQACGSLFSGMSGNCGQPGQVSPPSPSDSFPSGNGGLKKDENGVITTPGGYKIEATGKFDWKITSPDGKESTITGDPHVKDGDGTKWDFKQDSTFMLPDGTKIDVTTAPWGNGDATVTKELSITNGNDRVQVTGIDQGKGQVGEITKDGFDHVNDFAGKQVFVMSKDGTDFYLNGQEIEGNENGADTFKLGQPNPDIQNPGQMNDISQLLQQLFQLLFGGQGLGAQDLLGGGNTPGGELGMGQQNGLGQQDNFLPQNAAANQAQGNQAAQEFGGGNGLLRMLGSLIQMFQALARIAQLLQQFNFARQPQMA